MRCKLFLCLCASAFVSAQEINQIQADRPDQTETPYLVAQGKWQVEVGVGYEKSTLGIQSAMLPTILWKYGVNENFELRLITEYAFNDLTKNDQGVPPILVGCKIKIADEHGIFPKIAFIGHVSLPKIASRNYKESTYDPQFRVAMQHTLSEKMSLSYNLGAEWTAIEDESIKPTFIYTLTAGYAITPKLGSYMEVYGFAPQKTMAAYNTKASHNADGGLTYLINDNFMVDLSAGIGLLHSELAHYIAAGFSFRL